MSQASETVTLRSASTRTTRGTWRLVRRHGANDVTAQRRGIRRLHIAAFVAPATVDVQAIRQSLAAKLPAWRRPLPFQYESSGEVTQFTNWMDPHARSRDVFSFQPQIVPANRVAVPAPTS